MATSPERLQELMRIGQGQQTAPSVKPVQQPTSTAPRTKMDIASQGIEDQAKWLRGIPVVKQGFDLASGIGNAGAKLVPGFAGSTLNLASSFANKQ